MKEIIVMVYLLVVTIGVPCVPYNGSFLDAAKYNHTSAAPISKDDLPKILQIYGNISTLGEYKISLQYGVYGNVDSLCIKESN